MPHCDCGFDFVKARIKRRPLVSYALIPHKSYRAAIRREYAIVVEKSAEKKHRRIANASGFVGSLTQCPRCGAWLFDEPRPRPQAGFVVLHRAAHTAKSAAGKRGIRVLFHAGRFSPALPERHRSP